MEAQRRRQVPFKHVNRSLSAECSRHAPRDVLWTQHAERAGYIGEVLRTQHAERAGYIGLPNDSFPGA
jgi:hypothetical protein